MATLKDADISIRRRGLDLLFTMCNKQNVRDIVDELLKYLEIADFTMRDELVLKTAVLAERYWFCPCTWGLQCFTMMSNEVAYARALHKQEPEVESWELDSLCTTSFGYTVISASQLLQNHVLLLLRDH